MLVGRRTMQDFPGGQPLKGRDNLVLTRQAITIPGATVVHSEAEAAEAAAQHDRCLVIGGASVYRQMLPWVDTVHITKIALAPPSDSFFPDLDASSEWSCAESGPWLEENGVRYCFCTYRRNPGKEESSL